MLSFQDRQDFKKIPDSFAERHISLREEIGDNIYLTSEGGRGVVFEIPGIYDEPKNVEGSESLTASFSILFKALRELARGVPDDEGNVSIQIICSQRHMTTPPEKRADNKVVEYSESTLGKILNQYERDIFTVIKPVRRKFYLAIHYQPLKRNFLDGLIKSAAGIFVTEAKQEDDLTRKLESAKREFQDKVKALELQLSYSFPLRRINSEELIGYIQDILHCGQYQQVYDTSTDIHEAIYNPPMSTKKDGLYWNEKCIKPFVLHHIPEPKKFSFGQIRHFIDSIPLKDWDLVWCFTDGSYQPRSHFIFNKMWYSWAGNGTEKVEDYEDFEGSINYSHPFGTQSIRLLTYSPTEAQESVIKSNATNFLNARMLKEEEIPVHILSTSLPLNIRKDWHKIKGITREIRLEDSAAFWPLYNGPSEKEGTRLYISRYGTPTCFNRFGGQELRTTAILGQARKGKSSETNIAIAEFLETQKGLVRGIDARTSYRKVADLCGGRIVDFSLEAMINDPYSPFAGVDDDDETEIDRLFNIIVTALHLANDSIVFDSTHKDILKQSLGRAFRSHMNTVKAAENAGSAEEVNPHPVWDDVKSEFEDACQVLKADNVQKLDEAKSDLVKWGLGLSEGGEFGYIFSRFEKRDSIPPNTPILIYDIGEIEKSKEGHQILATQIAASRIKRDISYDFGEKSIPKMVIFEEFGLLVKGEGAAAKYMSAFASDIIKSGPKRNTFVVAVTNSVSDYCTPVGEDLWSNASQKIFLPLGDMITKARKEWEEEYTEAEWQIIGSLELEKHLKRSAAYISSKVGRGYKGSVFLPLTPLVDALITTNDSQLKIYDSLREKGKSPLEALEYMALNHPFGKGL